MIRYLCAAHHPPFARALGIPLTLEHARAAGSVALTFDDGPHPEGTPAVLEILAAHQMRATFFVVGEQVVQRPQLLQRVVAEGHQVELHCYRHRWEQRLGRKTLVDDFTRGTAAIEDAIGRTPILHRAPRGLYSKEGLGIARERGLQPLLWSRWGADWRRFTSPARIARRAGTNLQAGDVILLHDADYYSSERSHERTAAALPVVLAGIKAAGLGTVHCA